MSRRAFRSTLGSDLSHTLEALDHSREIPDVAPTCRRLDRSTMTARISIEDSRLRIHRTGVARWFGTSLDVPLAHVVSVGAAHPQDLKTGVRLAGIQLPGLMTSGIYRHDGQLTWWDVGRDSDALVITLRDERLARVVIGVGDPTAVRRDLDQALADAAIPPEATRQATDSRE